MRDLQQRVGEPRRGISSMNYCKMFDIAKFLTLIQKLPCISKLLLQQEPLLNLTNGYNGVSLN